MEIEKEIEEIKKRLTLLEGRLQQEPQTSSSVKPFITGFVVVALFIFISIGIYHFLSG
jgi:hypothetical protein